MTCSIPDGIELYFPRSGVRIRPIEGDINIQGRNYAKGTFALSKAAGEVVGNNTDNKEPVIFRADGTDAYRFVSLDDSLEFRRNFDREDEAVLTLYDARRVLDTGVISNSWKSADFSDVVGYILENREDPHGVIESIKYVGKVDQEEMVADAEKTPPSERRLNLGVFFDSLALETELHPSVKHVDFDNITPLKALEQITEELGYNFWVDIDGTINIGLDETWGQIMGVVDRKTMSIRRLDVIEANNKVNRILVAGPHESQTGWFKTGSLHGAAFAEAEDIEGGPKDGGIVKAGTLDDIRYAAERMLLREIMGNEKGSMVINGLASNDTERLAKLTVGDHFVIDGDAFDSCRTEVNSGHYTVKNVQHRINPRQGWRVDIDIARVPTEINSKTFFYDPQDGKRYDTIRAYEAEQIRIRGPQ